MHRFFIDRIPDTGTFIFSDASQIHHMKDVMRLSAGDQVVVCDNAGNECVCRIGRFSVAGAQLEIKERMKAVPPKTTLTVACAIPKKDKMDDIVDKLTQLGVQGIIPMQTARVVALPPEESRKGKLERWQRIARAASQQSRRDHVPVVSQITDIGKVISTPQRFDLKLVLTLEADARNIGNVLAGTLPSAVLLMIGPEGDFTPEEVESARKAGFIPTSLGIHVLRVETAAIAVTSYLSVALGI